MRACSARGYRLDEVPYRGSFLGDRYSLVQFRNTASKPAWGATLRKNSYVVARDEGAALMGSQVIHGTLRRGRRCLHARYKFDIDTGA